MDSSYVSDHDEVMEDSHGDSRFKSKNLAAERRRRAKLNDRLLQLRAIVPIITNMTKAYIIKDAITYIEELDCQVSELKDELLELGNSPPAEEIKPAIEDRRNIAAREMMNYGIIQPEVKVIPIDENKIWVKVVYEKKLGGFRRLVEAITRLGFEFNDTNLTTSNGASVISSCLEVINDGYLNVEQAAEMIMSVISNL